MNIQILITKVLRHISLSDVFILQQQEEAAEEMVAA